MPDHAISQHPAVQAQLDRLSLLSPGRDTLGLERITALCERLGNPQDKLPPVFHVAGTNGKGSTCAFLRAAIEASGQSAHVYSSPHLVRFNERIRVAGKLIDDELLAALLEEVLNSADGLEASFFEVTTAAAFLAFSRTPADACILEVGLGGRLDATNVIAQPAACGIAALGIDHEGFLLSPEDNVPADPYDRIAFEKAGIAKADTPLIIQKYRPSMQLEIAKQTMSVGAQMVDRGDGWDAAAYEEQLHYRDDAGKLTLPLPRMKGAHQVDNAALATAMLRHQDAVSVPESATAAAMEWTNWPARLQRLDDGPLTGSAPEADIWIDGGHNADAAEALRHFMRQESEGKHAKFNVILGMLANKDAEIFIKTIAPFVSSLRAIPIVGHEHHDPFKIAIMAKKAGISETGTAPNVEVAIAETEIRSRPGENYAPILIAGSLYLAGEVLKANNQLPD